MTSKEKSEILSLVRDMIKKEIDRSVSNNKKEMEKFVEKEYAKLEKTVLNKDDIKKLLIKAFVQQNKFMWEKSSFITQYINNI